MAVNFHWYCPESVTSLGRQLHTCQNDFQLRHCASLLAVTYCHETINIEMLFKNRYYNSWNLLVFFFTCTAVKLAYISCSIYSNFRTMRLTNFAAYLSAALIGYLKSVTWFLFILISNNSIFIFEASSWSLLIHTHHYLYIRSSFVCACSLFIRFNSLFLFTFLYFHHLSSNLRLPLSMFTIVVFITVCNPFSSWFVPCRFIVFPEIIIIMLLLVALCFNWNRFKKKVLFYLSSIYSSTPFFPIKSKFWFFFF